MKWIAKQNLLLKRLLEVGDFKVVKRKWVRKRNLWILGPVGGQAPAAPKVLSRVFGTPRYPNGKRMRDGNGATSFIGIRSVREILNKGRRREITCDSIFRPLIYVILTNVWCFRTNHYSRSRMVFAFRQNYSFDLGFLVLRFQGRKYLRGSYISMWKPENCYGRDTHTYANLRGVPQLKVIEITLFSSSYASIRCILGFEIHYLIKTQSSV